MVLEFAFTHDYAIGSARSCDEREHTYEFPRTPRAGRSSIEIQVVPTNGPAWTGLFRCGDLTKSGRPALFTWPAPTKLCVVCGGAAYLVDIEHPEQYEEIGSGMVVWLRPVPEHGLILIADPWEIAAYGRHGRQWSTGRIAIDGMRVATIQAGWLEVAIDDDDGSRVRIDVATGRLEGAHGRFR